ncbi:hypothetical protein BGZ58_003772, partial [Dissophora ornata]
MDDGIKLFCVVEGDSIPFPVKISLEDTVGDLKDAIKTKITPRFDDIPALELVLGQVLIPILDEEEEKPIKLNAVLTTADGNTAEDSVDEINDTPINGARDSDADNDASGVAVDTLAVGGVSIA